MADQEPPATTPAAASADFSLGAPSGVPTPNADNITTHGPGWAAEAADQNKRGAESPFAERAGQLEEVARIMRDTDPAVLQALVDNVKDVQPSPPNGNVHVVEPSGYDE